MRRKLLSLGLAAVLILSGCGAGENAGSAPAEAEKPPAEESTVRFDAEKSAPAGKKEETVTIHADASGVPERVTVSCRLYELAGDEFVLDRSVLSDITNTDGDEEYEQSGDRLLWQNLGREISYEADTDMEVPVAVHIHYFLDGNELEPSEIAGKSGSVKIRFEYENELTETVTVKNEEKTVRLPLLFITAAMLPEDHFKDIEVENGRLMSVGGTQTVIGYAIPGLADTLALKGYEGTEEIDLPEFLEITATADEFALDFTATAVSGGLFEDMETDKLDDGDDLIKDMDELKDGVNDLADGTSELSDGVGELADGVDAYVDGAGQLDDGVKQLESGMSKLTENSQSLRDGAEALETGLDELNTSLAGLDPDSLGGSGIDTSSITSAATALAADAATLSSEMESLQTSFGTISSSLTATAKNVENTAGYLTALYSQLETMKSTHAEDETYVSEITACEETLNSAITELGSISAPDLSGLDTSAITSAASDMGTQLSTLQTAFASLEGLADVPAELKKQVKALKKGVKQLAKGAEQLSSGVDAYTGGVDTISSGVSALSEGSGALSSNGPTLTEAMDKLKDGVSELADGVKEFNEDGVDELTDMAGDDLQAVFDGLRGVVSADAKSRTFSGCADETRCSVRYIIETKEIES